MLILLKCVAGLSLIGITIFMQLQVFCRYVLNYSLSWPDELAGILLAILTFVGAAIGMRHNDHISFTALLERLNTKWRVFFHTLSDLITMCYIGVILVYSIPLITRTWGQTPIGVPISRGLFYLVMWIGVAAMFCYAVGHLPVARRLLAHWMPNESAPSGPQDAP